MQNEPMFMQPLWQSCPIGSVPSGHGATPKRTRRYPKRTRKAPRPLGTPRPWQTPGG